MLSLLQLVSGGRLIVRESLQIKANKKISVVEYDGTTYEIPPSDEFSPVIPKGSILKPELRLTESLAAFKFHVKQKKTLDRIIEDFELRVDRIFVLAIEELNDLQRTYKMRLGEIPTPSETPRG